MCIKRILAAELPIEGFMNTSLLVKLEEAGYQGEPMATTWDGNGGVLPWLKSRGWIWWVEYAAYHQSPGPHNYWWAQLSSEREIGPFASPEGLVSACLDAMSQASRE